MKKVRILIAKPGLDGHSNGAEQIAVAARDAVVFAQPPREGACRAVMALEAHALVAQHDAIAFTVRA